MRMGFYDNFQVADVAPFVEINTFLDLSIVVSKLNDFLIIATSDSSSLWLTRTH